jgi:hypothetical protein
VIDYIQSYNLSSNKKTPECFQKVEKISSDAKEWSLFADVPPEPHIGDTEAFEWIKSLRQDGEGG